MPNLISISSTFFYFTTWPSRRTQFIVATTNEGFGNTGTHLLHRCKKQYRPFPGINPVKRAWLPFNTKRSWGDITWSLASAVRAHIQPHGPPLQRVHPQRTHLTSSLSPVWNSAILFSQHKTSVRVKSKWTTTRPIAFSVLQQTLPSVCTSACSNRNARKRQRRERPVYLLR